MIPRHRIHVALAVLAVAVTGAVWMLGSSHAADQVAVSWGRHSPSCTGTHVERHAGGDVIAAVPGMRCVISVRVDNRGPVSVHLDSATAPGIGATTGAVVAAANQTSSPGGGIDATFHLEQTVGAHRSVTFDIVTVFHPDGCNDDGVFRTSRWPHVKVRSLGLTHERAAAEDFAFAHRGRTPGCDAD